MNTRSRIQPVVFSFYLILAGGISAQTTWTVNQGDSGDFLTISAAIADPGVVPGDTILVDPGTYVENINYAGKDLRIESTLGPAATIIDGSGGQNTVVFISGETNAAVLKGFSITGGTSSSGAGINILNSSPTITDNWIFGNVCSGRGGGLQAYKSSLILTNNLIFDNLCASAGGGIAVRSTGSPIIANNMIYRNTATNPVGTLGGGISIQYTGLPVDGGNGALVVGNTVYDNLAETGSGMYVQDSTDCMVANCISWNNGPDNFFSTFAIVRFCDIESGGPLIGVDGNIEADPLFADAPGGDFHLTSGSPCIDAGDGDLATATDFEGDARIDIPSVPDTGTGTITYADIGADEFAAGTAPPSDVTCVPQGPDEVLLTWTNNANYDPIEIYRDGDLLDVLSGFGGGPPPTTYTDSAAGGGERTYTVVGEEAGIPSPPSDPCVATVPVEAPSGVTCDPIPGGDGVSLGWTIEEDNYTGIEIYRDAVLIASLGGTDTSYDDTSADARAGEFSYTVKGLVPGGEAESDPCVATVPVEPPTDLTCTLNGPDAIDLSWVNDDDPYTEIQIYRDGALIDTISGALTAYTDPDAGAGLREYSLIALVGTQASPPSNTCSETPPAEGPTDLLCTLTGPDTVQLDWVNNDPYGQIDVLRDGGVIDTIGGGLTTYTDSGVAPGTYQYQVRGTVDGSPTDPSNECEVTTTLGPPTDLTCSSPGPHQADLLWSNPVTYDSIDVWRDGAFLTTLPGSPTTYSDTTVDGGSHTYQLLGRLGVDETSLTDPCSVDVPVAAPEITSCTAGAEDGATIEWLNGDAYTSIEIVRDGVTIATVGPGDTSYTDGSVDSGTYAYQVVGYVGAFSAPSATCEVTVPLDPPADVSCLPDGDDGALLGWTNSDAYDAVEIRRDGDLIATLPGDATGYSDAAAGGGPRTYTVTGVVGASSATSAPCDVIVPLEGPSGLVCTPTGSVDLSWTNEDPYDEIAIYRDGGGSPIATIGGTETSYTDSTVGGGSHAYEVIGIANGAPSPGATCEVDVPVAPPTGLDCQATGADEVTLSWTNAETYDEIQVWRDGGLLATLPGTATSYADGAAGGGPRTYSVIARIGTVESDPATCALDVPVDAPSGLDCTITDDDNVNLSWTNEDEYDAIEILKDGLLIATLPAGSTSYSDPEDGAGTRTYEVRGTIGAVVGASATCEVVLPVDAPTDLTCTLAGSVQLDWVNHDPYDEIEIWRDGALLTAVGSGVVSYLDETTDPGPHDYALVGKIGEEGAQSETCSVEEPLPPVTDLACVVDGFDVQLNWTNGYAYEEIRIFRDGALVATLAGDATTAMDTVPSNGSYDYWVRGVYRGVLSDGVTDRCSVTIEATPPVEDLNCNAGGWTTTLSWQNPIVYDQITISRDGTPVGTLDDSPTLYEDDVPGPGEYCYTVVATKDGRDSDPVECCVTHTFIPAPAELDCQLDGAGIIHLSWTNGMAYGAVVVSRDGVDIATLPGTAIAYDEPAPGVGTFAYGVRGVVDPFPPSAEATCQVVVPATPAVSGLTCAPDGFTVHLAWTNEGTYTGIEVLRGETSLATLAGDATSYDDTVSGPGPYAYAVIASVGPIAADPTACAVEVTFVPPVVELACEATLRRVSLSWTNGFDYTEIRVRRNGVVVATLPGTETAYAELAPSGSYIYDVIGLVYPYASEPASCQVDAVGFRPPQNLVCEANRHNNLLSWTNAEAYDSIQILRDGVEIAQVSGTVTSYVDPVPRGTYLYELFGIIGGQPSEEPASCAVTNAYVDPPEDLACAADIESLHVTLTWTNGEAYENVEIWRDGSLLVTLGGNATTYEDTVPAETSYTYAVVGVIGPYRSAEAICSVRLATGFIRADVNIDTLVDIGDAVFVLNFLFGRGPQPPCRDAADANTDQEIDIGDAIYIIAYLFQDGALPSAPFPVCGTIPPEASLGCESFPPCDAP